MRMCHSCSLKDSRCHDLCTDIQLHLRNSRNYKTTYVNMEVGLTEVHSNQVHESLGEYLDTSGSFTEKYGHLLPTITQIVIDHGTDRQKQVYFMWVSDKMSFPYIGEQLYMKVQSVHEVIYGHHGQGGLIRKIRKHLAELPEADGLL